MEFMRSDLEIWVDTVGELLPRTIQLSQKHTCYGSKDLSQWYGIGDPRVGFFDKLKMAWKNG